MCGNGDKMSISPYVAALRKRIGTSRLLLPSVTAIVYGEQGEILLVKQRDGNIWSTPGGAIEPDEDPVDAVVREACLLNWLGSSVSNEERYERWKRRTKAQRCPGPSRKTCQTRQQKRDTDSVNRSEKR